MFQEFLKCTVDFADLVGLHFVMSKVAGKGQLKFMIAGMGWATAELVMTRYGPWSVMHSVVDIVVDVAYEWTGHWT